MYTTINSKAKQLIGICAHIGNHRYNWNPETERFAIGYRNSTMIFNLSLTNFYFNRALGFVEKLSKKFGRIFIYGLNEKNDRQLVKRFTRSGQVVCTTNWKGGFVSNAKLFGKTIKNTRKKFSAALSLRYDYQNYSFPLECKNLKIPSICIVDSDVSPENFSYPIPINSKSHGGAEILSFYFLSKVFNGTSQRILSRYSRKLKIVNLRNVEDNFSKKSYSAKSRKLTYRIQKLFKRNKTNRLPFKRKKFNKRRKGRFFSIKRFKKVKKRVSKILKDSIKIFKKSTYTNKKKKNQINAKFKRKKTAVFFKKVIKKFGIKELSRKVNKKYASWRKWQKKIRSSSNSWHKSSLDNVSSYNDSKYSSKTGYVMKTNKNYGRRWNRTTTASFSGLYSTIELSPSLYFLIWQNFLNRNLIL